MSKLFSSPPKPKVVQQELPKTPTDTDPEVQQKSVDAKKQLRRSGRGQTILTSPTGVASTGPTMSKTLLGA